MKKRSSQDRFLYFGYGFSGYSEPDPNWTQYGFDIPWYTYCVYIGADDITRKFARGY